MDNNKLHKDMTENLSIEEIREIARIEAAELLEKSNYFIILACQVDDNGEVVTGRTITSPVNKTIYDVLCYKFMDWMLENSKLDDALEIKHP